MDRERERVERTEREWRESGERAERERREREQIERRESGERAERARVERERREPLERAERAERERREGGRQWFMQDQNVACRWTCARPSRNLPSTLGDGKCCIDAHEIHTYLYNMTIT